MRQNKTESLGDIIQSWLNQNKLNVNVQRASVINHWDKYVGAGIKRYTESITIEGSQMRVKIRSAVAKRELDILKDAIIERINKDAGYDLITDIVFIS